MSKSIHRIVPYILVTVILLLSSTVNAIEPTSVASTTAQSSESQKSPRLIVCESIAGKREHCPADTSSGVLISRSFGTFECILGRTWGYDAEGIWVSDGCSAEFAVGSISVESGTPAAEPPKPEYTPIETWGEFEPGEGFLVGRNNLGSLSISAYGLLRYVGQFPDDQTYTDHLGNEHAIDARNDFFPHRAMIFFKGWLANPKLVYNLFIWTVNTTDQRGVFPTIGYQFSRKFSLYGGLNGLPGSRSVQGSHPYWLGHDRVMADEFFRPYFTFGVWATGEITPGLWYNAEIGNNSSALGITAAQLDREFSSMAFSTFWMPTTNEFGPKGAFGDWEGHDNVATRFGTSFSYSPEERFPDPVTGSTDNTTLKLADGLNIFAPGSLAEGVTVNEVNYRMLAFDAGMKYKGFFLQTEIYNRWLDNFVADGPLPVESIFDTGFYVQASFFPIPKKLELYGATSQVFGDKDAGFENSSEYLLGMNFYPFDTRNHRLNVQLVNINRSPVGSTFGYYTTGQDGTIVSTAFSVFF